MEREEVAQIENLSESCRERLVLYIEMKKMNKFECIFCR